MLPFIICDDATHLFVTMLFIRFCAFHFNAPFCCGGGDSGGVAATNQAGIAKGLYRVEDMRALHRFLDEQLAEASCRVDAYYYCPHHPDYTGACDCRKPAPDMLLAALRDFDADAPDCVLYGDSASDLQAAVAAGVRGVLVG